MASYETLDYTICFNGHNVTCFKVGSVPTIGYASLEDAIQNTNSVILPDMVFDAVEDILDHGIIPTTIWIDFNPVSGHGWCNWEEETVLSKADIVMIEESNAIRKTHENRKQRRSARRVQNARHKSADRKHGKRHGDKYLESLPRKKYLEADNYDHPTFRVEKGKLHPIHDVKRERETARVRDAMDVSEIERLTASVLAEVQQYHGMVGCTWNVFYLSEAICQREQLPYPDYAYVREQKNGKIELILEYVEYDFYEDYTTYECFDLLHI